MWQIINKLTIMCIYNIIISIYIAITTENVVGELDLHTLIHVQPVSNMHIASVMCQLPTGTNYRKSRANYRHIVYVWSTDKFTERGRAISGRSIEAYPPVFDFARFLDSEVLSKAISHSLGCK